ncbi:MAG: MASE1 domain-containing protein, partial [Archangium sp.]|nr:MASE1 domain-containing protein [Archangium sp.]
MKKQLLIITGLAAAYAVSGTLGMLVASPPGNVTSVWFPAGISLAVLLKWGDRAWPGITIGAFITNILFFPAQGSTLTIIAGAFAIAAGSTFGNRLTRWLVERTCGLGALARPGLLLTFTACVMVGCALNASIGMVSTIALGGLTASSAGSFWFTWWLGDAVGMLLIAPLVLSEGSPVPRRPWEWFGAIALTVVVTQVVFGRPIPGLAETSLPMAWTVLPPIVWAGARLGVRGATAITLLLFALITWATLSGTGPFGHSSRSTSLLMIDGLLTMVVMTGLLLVAATAAVRGQQVGLEERVRERTRELESANRALRTEVDERVRLTARLVEAQKQEALGRLAGGIAHDFNNLLTVVSGEAELLALGQPDSPAVHDGAEAILAATHRAAELTRQLLTVARRQPSTPIAVDLAEQLTEARRLLRPLFPESVSLDLDTQSGCTILIDPTQLDQLVLNLALNARDACSAGGAVRIANFERTLDDADATRMGLAAGRWVVLELTDTGTGIAPEVLPRIFEPFFTTKSEERGTGLGLSTVWGIANQAGGTVRVESTIGWGSKFEVWLPRTDQRPSTIPISAATAENAPSSATVLVVEDEPLVRRTVVLSLERAGYRVLTASDGEEGLNIARQNPAIDLVLTDVVMPRMGGVDLARQLRALRNVPVIFMSGFHEHQTDLSAEEV